MTITEIQEKILADSKFVESELLKITQYYQLKHTLRWGFSNNEEDVNESVAEHVYGMNILTEYFLPLHKEKCPDSQSIREMILWHDMAETITTDMPSKTKTDSHRNKEKEAEEVIKLNTPLHLKDSVSKAFALYEAQATSEARFVKAIDKLEPMLHMYFVAHKPNTNPPNMKWPVADYRTYRKKYLASFPLLMAFDVVIERAIADSGYFPKSA